MRRKKNPVFQPGMYEGKTAEEVRRTIGTNVPPSPGQSFTPASMRQRDMKTMAIRRDGKLCRSLNGL